MRIFSVILQYGYTDCDNGVNIQFRTDGGLFNQGRFSASKAFGLTIIIKKTKFLHQSKPSQHQTDDHIYIDGTPLKNVDTFVYLGSTVTSNASLDKEIASRIGRASSSFNKFTDRLWKDHDISLKTKMSVYIAVVFTTLLYGSETWTLYRKQIRQLDAFHMRCLRSICGLTWSDRVRNSDILSKCNTTGIETFQNLLRISSSGKCEKKNN